MNTFKVSQVLTCSASSRKRTRLILSIAVAAATATCTFLPSVQAFNPASQNQFLSSRKSEIKIKLTSLEAATKSSTTVSASVDTLTTKSTSSKEKKKVAPTSRVRKVARTENTNRFHDFDHDVDDEDEDEFEFSVKDFLKLQESTGSEVLQSELQQQIDAALETHHPELFLNWQAGELPVSELEKLAMSSVTAQLPQRAVEALAEAQPLIKTGKELLKDLNFAVGKRVTREQELELARMIQKGAALQSTKQKLEQKLGREPSKLEWATAVGMSAKDLRQQISKYRKAKHDLVTANIGLVHAVVKQQWASLKKSSGITREELVQEGSLGLLRAAELFDPSRGLRFSTYAVVWIKGHLSNSHCSELVRLPQREKSKWNKIQKAQKELEMLRADGGQNVPITIDEISKVTGLANEDIMITQRRMSQAQRLLSLDYEYQQQSRSGMETSSMGSSSLEKDKNMQDDFELAERTQLHADVLAALAQNLDSREARLMRLRYGLSDGQQRSYHECADAMGLSYTRVYQLATRCLNKLRQAKEVEALEEYLLTIA